MNNTRSNPWFLPLLLALFGGGLPILFGGDTRLLLLIIIIFFGLAMIMLFVKVGIARNTILFGLGASLIINPNKYFLTESVTMVHAGGISVPFLSLTDLAILALFFAQRFSKDTDDIPRKKLPRFVIFALCIWVAAMVTSLFNAKILEAGFWHLTFELKCLFLFFVMAHAGQGKDISKVMKDFRFLFLGIAAGLFFETLAVLAEYLNLVGSSVSFLGVQISGFKESLGGIATNRVGGTYRHPNYLAIPMAALLLPTATMTVYSKGIQRVVFGLATACTILNLLLTLSRGGWLAMAVCLIFFFGLLTTTKAGLAFLKKNLRIICILGLFSVVALGYLSGEIANKLFHSSGSNISGRVILNEMGIEMIKDHPFMGLGLNNAVNSSAEYGLLDQFLANSAVLPVIHNIYLIIGAEIGIPGLVAFVTMALFLIANGLAQARRNMHLGEAPMLLAALAASVFAFLVADMFGPGLRKLEISYHFWLQLGAVACLTNTLAASTQKSGEEALKND